jgi:hypothetical protein
MYTKQRGDSLAAAECPEGVESRMAGVDGFRCCYRAPEVGLRVVRTKQGQPSPGSVPSCRAGKRMHTTTTTVRARADSVCDDATGIQMTLAKIQ